MGNFFLVSDNFLDYNRIRCEVGFYTREKMKELIERIAKALVDNPDDVRVNAIEGEQSTMIELSVNPTDLGKVIGRQGRTANAIRVILGAAGMTLGKRINLEILEK
jgi:predicted RNA-binding protein YlqC (UPF0109 family)